MNDPYHLQRFVDAQANQYQPALQQLEQGRKTGHWMWYIFPQLKGLGFSSTAKFYGLSGKDEALAYLQHRLLGPRLLECTKAVTRHENISIEQIFGYPDHLKFCSCMTLFDCVAGSESSFEDALRVFCNGKPDQATLELLRQE